jgi:hypothetical protein
VGPVNVGEARGWQRAASCRHLAGTNGTGAVATAAAAAGELLCVVACVRSGLPYPRPHGVCKACIVVPPHGASIVAPTPLPASPLVIADMAARLPRCDAAAHAPEQEAAQQQQQQQLWRGGGGTAVSRAQQQDGRRRGGGGGTTAPGRPRGHAASLRAPAEAARRQPR